MLFHRMLKAQQQYHDITSPGPSLPSPQSEISSLAAPQWHSCMFSMRYHLEGARVGWWSRVQQGRGKPHIYISSCSSTMLGSNIYSRDSTGLWSAPRLLEAYNANELEACVHMAKGPLMAGRLSLAHLTPTNGRCCQMWRNASRQAGGGGLAQSTKSATLSYV